MDQATNEGSGLDALALWRQALGALLRRPLLNLALAYIVATPLVIGHSLDATIANAIAQEFYSPERPDLSVTGVVATGAVLGVFWIVVASVYLAFAYAVFSAAIDAQRQARDFTIGHGIGHAMLDGWRLAPLAFVVTFCAVAGGALLVAPGVIATVYFLAALPIAAQRRTGIMESLRLSSELAAPPRLYKLVLAAVPCLAAPFAAFLMGGSLWVFRARSHSEEALYLLQPPLVAFCVVLTFFILEALTKETETGS